MRPRGLEPESVSKKLLVGSQRSPGFVEDSTLYYEILSELYRFLTVFVSGSREAVSRVSLFVSLARVVRDV